MGFLLRVVINAVAIWLATVLISGLTVEADEGAASKILVLLAVGLVFGIVNALVRPLVKLLSFPLYILTLGLFSLVVNALMLMLTGWITEFTDYGLRVADFWSALLGGLIIGIVSFILSLVLRERR